MNVQSPSYWRMGENGERPGCRLSADHNYFRHHIQQHNRTGNTRKLEQMTGIVKAQKKQAYERDLYLAKGMICIDFALSHHLVYGTNHHSPGDINTVVDNSNSMVHLARFDDHCTLINCTESQAARGMGITRCSGDVTGSPAMTHVGAWQEERARQRQRGSKPGTYWGKRRTHQTREIYPTGWRIYNIMPST